MYCGVVSVDCAMVSVLRGIGVLGHSMSIQPLSFPHVFKNGLNQVQNDGTSEKLKF